MQCVNTREQPAPADLWERWSAIVSHSHMIRSHKATFEQAKRDLVAWCRSRRLHALGVGSPWEPVSAAHYGQYETRDRDLYYSGRVDPQSVMDRAPIAQLFEDLNGESAGATLFFQDNENPKGRMGHIWYFGYHYDFPAWHDYSQDRPIQVFEADPHVELNALTGLPHRRRCALEIVASQRRAGALAVWAHPTSWWWQGERFVTNIAAELVLHLLADGRVDGMVVQGYDACHRSYQALWWHLLDTGAVIPGFAESDGCFDTGTLRDQAIALSTGMPLPRPLTMDAIVGAARDGRVFATSGAFMELSIDGTPMGHGRTTGAGQVHRVRLEAYPVPGQSRFSRIDLIGRGGRILDSVQGFPGGVLEYTLPGSDQPAYVVARGFGETDDPDNSRQQAIRHMAITNPVYLQPRGFAFRPVETACRLTVASDSPWRDGTLEFQSADGAALESHRVCAGTLERTLPASARVCVRKEGRGERVFYIAMENERVESLLRYLHDGEFLRDYPGQSSGDVPAAAFRVADMKEALSRFEAQL